LKTNKVNLFVSSVLCVFWYHSPNVLDTLHICNISWLRVKYPIKVSFGNNNYFKMFVSSPTIHRERTVIYPLQ
jgi:hypothetical protein